MVGAADQGAPLCASVPVVAGRMGSGFGWRTRPSGPDLHTGVDIGAPEGSPVLAVLPGTVRGVWPSGALSGYGNTVVVEHGPGLLSLYAHLEGYTVRKGERVAAGELLGAVGRTQGTREDPSKRFGRSGSHLHFEFLSRWPPAGRDLDRLDPGPIFGSIGIVLPSQGFPFAAVGSGAACSPVERQAPAPANVQVVPVPRQRHATNSGALIAVLLALALARR